MSFFQKRRWLVEFGVVCLVPIVLIGLFLMQTLKSNVEGRALSNAREQARLVADVGLSTPLAGIDDLSHGLTSAQLQAIDHQLATIQSGNTLQRALIRDREGRIVYANDRSLIGQTNPSAGARNAALGAISSALTSSPQGKMLDVYVPIKVAGAPAAGSAELRFPYAPIASSIASQDSKIELMLIAGLVLLSRSRRSASAARPRRRRSRRSPTASPGFRTARCSPTWSRRRSPVPAAASTPAR
jgi:hypothetical protein